MTSETLRVYFIIILTTIVANLCFLEANTWGSDLGSLKQLSSYSLLNEKAYQRTVYDARNKLNLLIKKLKTKREQSADEKIAFIAKELSDIPYLAHGAMGEGDWQPSSLFYQPGSPHIKQHPVYRLDGFDCQTLIQVIMALLRADNLVQFEQHVLKIAYGAAGHPNGEIVRYYNRNNFIDGDFNPINQKNGYLQDVTSNGPLASFSALTYAMITRENWFMMQQQNMRKTVFVLHQKDGEEMVKRFKTIYSSLNFPRFKSEKVFLSYLPKEQLAIRKPDGSYPRSVSFFGVVRDGTTTGKNFFRTLSLVRKSAFSRSLPLHVSSRGPSRTTSKNETLPIYFPNDVLLNEIPTPSVIEIVRDAKKWVLHGKTIREFIGSELNVSHSGILYRETFKKGDVIYQKITCQLKIKGGQKQCVVIPQVCKTSMCRELMLVHATASHPDGYFWYQDQNGKNVCKKDLPNKNVPYSTCNRVERIPLFAYLTNFQYGRYWYMQSSSILGVHIEKIL